MGDYRGQPEPTKKVLCVCSGGNVRSVTTAFILKNDREYDAIAIGADKTRSDTLKMLCEWADIILVAKDDMKEKIPEEYKDKAVNMKQGEDRYGIPMHPFLMTITLSRIKELKDKNIL